jgi:hypothetical protein
MIGCHRMEPEPPVRYVASKCPKLIILKPIPNNYKVHDFKLKIKEDPTGKYYLVEKSDLKKASFTSQKKSILIEKQKRYIKFYEKEILHVKEACEKQRKKYDTKRNR